MGEKCLVCGRRIPFSFSWRELVALFPLRTQVLLPVQHWLCPDCQGELKWSEAGCVRCSKSLEEIPPHLWETVGDGVLCYDCQRWLEWEEAQGNGPVLLGNISAIRYNRWAQEVITRYKFQGDERLKYFLASLMVYHPQIRVRRMARFDRPHFDTNRPTNGSIENGVTLKTNFWNRVDLITAVPLSRKRLQERGFNQAERVAQLVAQFFRKPFMPNLLIRQDDDEKQSKRDRKERLAKMFDRFLNNPDHLADIKNKRIVLIDDIYTTGATMHAAAYALRRGGACEVVGFTIAR